MIFLRPFPGSVFLLTLCLHFFPLAEGRAAAPKEVTITLYQGQNQDIQDDLQEKPQLRKKLNQLFGYTHYQRIGTSMVYPHSYSPVTAWPNKLLSLTVYAVNPNSDRHEFELRLEEKSILKGSFIPKTGVPIIIKGPLYGQGQLIIVVGCAKL
jgi:hypothetical protein